MDPSLVGAPPWRADPAKDGARNAAKRGTAQLREIRADLRRGVDLKNPKSAGPLVGPPGCRRGIR
eukprot:4785340-Pyramimonas_sp.AAC.1